jgi:hypothetical protein
VAAIFYFIGRLIEMLVAVVLFALLGAAAGAIVGHGQPGPALAGAVIAVGLRFAFLSVAARELPRQQAQDHRHPAADVVRWPAGRPRPPPRLRAVRQ